MRAWLAIAVGIAAGAGIAWWLARESPEAQQHTQTRARQANAQAQDARPSLYRWRDDAGVLQITDHPPKGRRYERLDRDMPAGIRVEGDRAGPSE